jgi:uncharacterized protein (UPF0335 family)
MAEAKTTNGIKHSDVVRLLGKLDQAETRKNAIQADIRTIYDDGEAKGITRKHLKAVFARSKLSPADRAAADLMNAVLERAAGLDDTAPTYDEASGCYAMPTGIVLEDDDAETETEGDEGIAPAPPEPPKGRRGRGRRVPGDEAIERAEQHLRSDAESTTH